MECKFWPVIGLDPACPLCLPERTAPCVILDPIQRFKIQYLLFFVHDWCSCEADDALYDRFRWVACQMDYLCDLPTDGARKRELNKLPPTLNATYERILRKVNQSNDYVQAVVRRSLQWISNSRRPLSTTELCEAISIEPGAEIFDRDAVPLEEEILRCCSSLVCVTASGTMELAHFTIKEFLIELEHRQDNEFSAYRANKMSDDLQLGTVCLTYVLFRDFAEEPVDLDEPRLRARKQRFAFRSYAVDYWASHVRENPLEQSVYGLIQQLFDFCKPNLFISWAQEFGLNVVSRIDSTTERPSTWMAVASPLHYAAILALPEICEWLVASGSDVNQFSALGSPLHCSLIKTATFCGPILGRGNVVNYLHSDTLEYTCMHDWPEDHTHSTIKTILEAGADPNCRYHLEASDLTPLELAVYMKSESTCRELLKNGASLDGATANAFYWWIEATKWEENSKDGPKTTLKDDQIRADNATGLLQLALAPESSISFDIRNADEGYFANPLTSFVIAAKFGQVAVMKRLLQVYDIDVNAKSSCKTALHKAARGNHPDAVKFLISRGAKLDVTDRHGRTPLHVHLYVTQGSCHNMLVEEHSYSRETLDGSTALHIAVEWGSIESVEHLLKNGCDPCAVKHDGSTAHHCAICRSTDVSRVRIVDLLLKAQVGPLKIRSDGMSPLHLLTRLDSQHTYDASSLEILRKLTKNALVLGQPDAKGMTAIHHICSTPGNTQSWSLAALEVLLSSNADIRRHDLMGRTPLRLLVDGWKTVVDNNDLQMGSSKVCATMVSIMLDYIDTGEFLMEEILFLALRQKDERLTQKILQLKPNVDAKSHQKASLTPLQAACFYGCSRPLLRQLLDRSRYRAAVDGFGSGLLRLACQGNESAVNEVVLELLEASSDPNGRISHLGFIDGRTALMEAARQGNPNVVETLLFHKADFSATDHSGWSVVHHACIEGHVTILCVLQRYQIDWNARIRINLESETLTGATALHLAASIKDSGPLEFLLARKVVADINATTTDGTTALTIAAWHRHSHNVALLLSNKADDMIPENNYGECPLHLAARNGYLDIVSTFIDYGVNVRVKDHDEMTPELIARDCGRFDVADLLEEYSRGEGAFVELVTREPKNMS